LLGNILLKSDDYDEENEELHIGMVSFTKYSNTPFLDLAILHPSAISPPLLTFENHKYGSYHHYSDQN